MARNRSSSSSSSPSVRSKQRRSLCEESMLMVVNILRLSSLSLVRSSGCFRPGSVPTSHHQHLSPPANNNRRNAAAARDLRPGSATGSRKLMTAQKLETDQQGSQRSYVMLPAAEAAHHHPTEMAGPVGVSSGGSDRTDDDVATAEGGLAAGGADGKFSEYIRRFHKKTEDEMQNAIVEGRASDYIKRFHEKNRVVDPDDQEGSAPLPFIGRPPHLHLAPPSNNYSPP